MSSSFIGNILHNTHVKKPRRKLDDVKIRVKDQDAGECKINTKKVIMEEANRPGKNIIPNWKKR